MACSSRAPIAPSLARWSPESVAVTTGATVSAPSSTHDRSRTAPNPTSATWGGWITPSTDSAPRSTPAVAASLRTRGERTAGWRGGRRVCGSEHRCGAYWRPHRLGWRLRLWWALRRRRGRWGLQRWRGLRRGCRRWRGDRWAFGRGRGLWRALRRRRGLRQCRATDHRERRADSHPFPGSHEQLLYDAGLEAFDVDGRFVGVHDGHHITSGHPLPGLDQPFDHGPGIHIRSQRRHHELTHFSSLSMSRLGDTPARTRGSCCRACGIPPRDRLLCSTIAQQRGFRQGHKVTRRRSSVLSEKAGRRCHWVAAGFMVRPLGVGVRWVVNQSRANSATCSSVPGSSNR